jgi:hypothetical protein
MLLSAWNSGDLARLRDAIDQVGRRAASPGDRGSEEQERMETIMAVSERMQGWLRNNGESDPDDLRACMRLLRHLAGLDGPWHPLKVAPQLETRASCPR